MTESELRDLRKGIDQALNEIFGRIEFRHEVVHELVDPEALASRLAAVMRYRIAGGEEDKNEDAPECVAVASDSRYQCSGILLHEKWVLTVQHCLKPTHIFVGRDLAHRKLNVSEFVVSSHTDIAGELRLLNIDGIPSRANLAVLRSTCTIGGKFTIAGFGDSTAEGAGLRHVGTVSLVVNTPRLETAAQLPDLADGDSGGPLLMMHEGRRVVVGVAQGNRENDTSGTGGVFTLLTKTICDEIDQVTQLQVNRCL